MKFIRHTFIFHKGQEYPLRNFLHHMSKIQKFEIRRKKNDEDQFFALTWERVSLEAMKFKRAPLCSRNHRAKQARAAATRRETRRGRANPP